MGSKLITLQGKSTDPTRRQIFCVRKDNTFIGLDHLPCYSDYFKKLKTDIIELQNNTRFHQLLVTSFAALMEDDYHWASVGRTYYNSNQPGISYYEPPTYTIDARPFIEWQFLNAPKDFIELMDTIIQSNNPSCYNAFVESVEKTSLSLTMLDWDQAMQANISSAIDGLSRYGKKLTEQHVAKGEVALQVVASLKEQLEAHEKLCLESKKEEQPWKVKLETLKFKLNLKMTLHHQDEKLNQYRGWGRLVVNLLSALGTLFIANAINYAATGNFWFFNNPSSGFLLTQSCHSRMLVAGIHSANFLE